MKITFPHMGNLQYVLSDLFDRVGTEYVLPPPTSNRTLALGVKHSPEMACLPLKVTIGNFIEALDAGADTLVMVGGIGPCRFGYYADIQRRIISELGYDFEMIIVEPPSAGWLGFLQAMRKITHNVSMLEAYRAVLTGFSKARYFDHLEKKVLQTRCLQTHPQSVTKAYKKACKILFKAVEAEEIAAAFRKGLQLINEVPKKEDMNPLRVGFVGEFYMLLEPFFNFDLEEWFGERGVYLERAVYLTDWISPSTENIVGGSSEHEIKVSAAPYLSHWVGGEGLATVGNTVQFAKRGFDGIIHMFPFTCMPDTIAKGILCKVSRELAIPVMSLVVDEQTGKAGVVTRLEAFLDLMTARRAKKDRIAEAVV